MESRTTVIDFCGRYPSTKLVVIVRKLLLLFSWSNLSKQDNGPASATLGCKTVKNSEKHTTRPSCTIQRHESYPKNYLKTLTFVTKIAMENKNLTNKRLSY